MFKDICRFMNSLTSEDVQVSPSSNKKVTATVTEDAVIAINVEEKEVDTVDTSHFAWVNAHVEAMKRGCR